MAGRRSRTLTEVELEIMQVIWPAGEITSEEVREVLKKQGHDLKDGSVRKMLLILLNKGYIDRRKEGNAFIYRAKVPEGQANRSMALDLLKRAFGGSASLMMATLFDAQAVTKKDIEQIKRLIAEREEER